MPRNPQRIDDLFVALTSDVAEISDARDHLGRWLAGWTDEEMIADLTLVLSELLANAMAASSDHAPVLVHACCDHGVLELEVANQVRPVPMPTAGWRLDDPLRGGGRGLLIVKAVVDDVQVRSEGPWTVVRCRHHLGPPDRRGT